ncbi:MAG: tRNA epoxyqueuosine(34) reductase QueG [Candidatus Eremiobacteraeota bacterium]|nr:tRNA epoxyqueuosine(34) reductase QueG [Candidatus Eremiobacteraeota bacterium]
MQRSHSDASDHSPRFDADALKARIVTEARVRGAVDVRVTGAAVDEELRSRLRSSFERGDLRTWPYDDAYARAASDPETVLAGARSIICIAVPYATPPGRRAPLQGRVSNYAWSEDYHHRMRTMLRELAALIDELAGAPVTSIACDTKPIAERAYAARAGLGWVGKHTNLISPRAGSFVFLGELITTLDLPPDAALRKTCGACRRCIDACPTGALRGDYTIDANRCIADLTQRTDAIPRKMRPLIGDWVWGCDICQDVCPPTMRAQEHGDERFRPFDATTSAPQLDRLLRLRSGEFKRRYARTAMGWRGAAVLRRNAAIALGNSLDRSAVGPLSEALADDPHPMVRESAAWALGRIGSPKAIAYLKLRYEAERDPSVRSEIAASLEPFTVPVR